MKGNKALLNMRGNRALLEEDRALLAEGGVLFVRRCNSEQIDCVV